VRARSFALPVETPAAAVNVSALFTSGMSLSLTKYF
jgi:hypothetical protein